ncbi:MAG: efflux transporter periplasmic adaptor subunit, partial [Gemmatimonadota bacterium]
RVVQLGIRSQGIVEIVNGVNAGEMVVVGGLERMGEGLPVAPRPRGQTGSDTPAAAGPPSQGTAPAGAEKK